MVKLSLDLKIWEMIIFRQYWLLLSILSTQSDLEESPNPWNNPVEALYFVSKSCIKDKKTIVITSCDYLISTLTIICKAEDLWTFNLWGQVFKNSLKREIQRAVFIIMLSWIFNALFYKSLRLSIYQYQKTHRSYTMILLLNKMDHCVKKINNPWTYS